MQGSTLHIAKNHHLPHQRAFLRPAVPRDLAADDYMPSSAQLLPTGVILSSPSQLTGEAKTREAQARSEGKHAKLTQSHTFKQHPRRMLKTKCHKVYWNKSAAITWSV